MDPMLTCGIAGDADEQTWQAYVRQNATCGLYHDYRWRRVITSAYGHDAPYLIAKRDGKVTGVLPLVLVRSRIFGSSLTSIPFVDFAGAVADDPDSLEALLDECRRIASAQNVDYIELRQLQYLEGGFSTNTEKVLMTLSLEPDEESAWARLSSERRNRVRRATKTGLSVEPADAARLSAFYDVWTSNMRDLGSPPHSLGFFERVLREFADDSVLFLVHHQDRCIGAALGLICNDVLSVPWVSSLRDSFNLYPNNLLYWEAMRYAIGRQLSVFDFGRSSRESGTFEFKKRWGAEATQLYWQVEGVGNAEARPATESAKLRSAVSVWKKLPLPVTRLIGPSIRKYITA